MASPSYPNASPIESMSTGTEPQNLCKEIETHLSIAQQKNGQHSDDRLNLQNTPKNPSLASDIPMELLQQIYGFLPFPTLKELSSNIPTSKTFKLYPSLPLRMSHVCQRWREIALATPELWSALHFEFPAFHILDEKVASDAINIWLNRSGSCSLFISVHNTQHYPQSATFLKTIAAFSKRWKGVSFNLDLKDLEAFATLRSEDVPLLRSLHIDYDSTTDPNILSKVLFVKQAPLLRSVGLPGGDAGLCRHMPWSQLTELTFNKPLGILEPLVVLRYCRNLQILVLDGTQLRAQWFLMHNSSLCQLPSVHTLYICGSSEPLRFLLQMPNLTALHIDGSRAPQHTTLASSYPNYAVPWGCPLKEVTLTSLHVSFPFELIDCLRRAPTLEKLTIIDCSPLVDETFLIEFTPPKMLVCPNLTSLEIRGCKHFPDQVFIDFVRARTEMAITFGIAQLETVIVAWTFTRPCFASQWMSKSRSQLPILLPLHAQSVSEPVTPSALV
ncbi:hypothetical protein Hypma_013565 [Hypsizygus marmoreus]|uniref:Uncharacterized protein n=1 Tax=Hypsizygus marmoreus TaxID=39966 RepID=A0A369JDI0_HYPMA|nr:hypothetical protein Hypma_013565 [Hypsizygus marmoreus]